RARISPALTDTTGSMGVLGRYLRENGKEHGYCTDHNLHRNAIRALLFDPKDVPAVAVALRKCRDIATFFNSSTQAVKELKKRQKESSSDKFSGEPKDVLSQQVT
ncbi:hypothetical protein THAOC_13377, partial [Thalassiosira oceanica]